MGAEEHAGVSAVSAPPYMLLSSSCPSICTTGSPCCDRDACPDGNPRAAKAKFFFHGVSGYGYICHRCGATRHDLEEKFGRWEGPIYLGDTDEGILELGRRLGMHIIEERVKVRNPIPEEERDLKLAGKLWAETEVHFDPSPF